MKRSLAILVLLFTVLGTSGLASTGAGFDGTVQSAWFNQSAPGRVTQLTGFDGLSGPVLRLVAYNGDVAPLTPTDNPRAQLVSPSIIQSGDVLWESFRMFLPKSFPSGSPAKWMVLWTQAYGPPFNGSGPGGLGVRGSRLEMDLNGYAPVPWKEVWSVPIPRGQWVRYTVHFLFSPDGWIELYVNGREQWLQEGTAPRTHHLLLSLDDPSNNGGPNSARIMVYYSHNGFVKATAYFADFKIGTTRAAVEG
jgi:hypothetical protein